MSARPTLPAQFLSFSPFGFESLRGWTDCPFGESTVGCPLAGPAITLCLCCQHGKETPRRQPGTCPLQFVLYYDALVRGFQERWPDMEMFVYADEFAPRAKNREDLHRALCMLTSIAMPMGL